MKYFIYLAVAGLTVWAVWYLVRQVRRQLRGGGCGCGCGGSPAPPAGKDFVPRREEK